MWVMEEYNLNGGENSPLIEHPLKEVTPNYWNKDERYLAIERRNGQK